MKRTPAVFLDRDGTINVERHYLIDPDDFEFFPGVPQAIRVLKEAGFAVVVVTNQSGVARGYFTLDDVEKLHRHVQSLLAEQGTAIDAFYVCPHAPDAGCLCRKGAPGLLVEAARDMNLDLEHSFMVGDKLSDVEAGRRSGCRPLLVRTGYGVRTAEELTPEDAVPVFADLPEAAAFILADKKTADPSPPVPDERLFHGKKA
ncbi:MAG: D-glycero-beta-D-manno-heptose 1,7-bisphosphate 7-phosphatase [Deltaproteobacteria bacterium]|nr:D-glycero-beta-D-manno-heptose 1,7-bisphosphate 7-phosphatase [Deltaproteobacteria bacterium]